MGNNIENNVRLDIFSYPYIKETYDTTSIMRDVIIALVPAMLGSIYFFGMKAALLIAISVVSCVGFEYITQVALKKTVRVYDLSAVVTGILLAMNLPATAPFWLPIFGGFFAIVIIKECFGGIGNNLVNPALGARAMLMSSWGGMMADYVGPDMVSGATPLELIKAGEGVASLPSVTDMAIGRIGGVLGETSAVLLLIGFIYLAIKKIVDVKIPVIYIGVTAISLVVMGTPFELLPYHIFGGGLFLGALFMATDYATIPYTNNGRIIFAVGCGFLTAIIRMFGSYPEGVSYAILVMNLFTPLIDKFVRDRVFGEVRS